LKAGLGSVGIQKHGTIIAPVEESRGIPPFSEELSQAVLNTRSIRGENEGLFAPGGEAGEDSGHSFSGTAVGSKTPLHLEAFLEERCQKGRMAALDVLVGEAF
jgi:hypothetical protein